jgi:hypothetical protein
MRFIADSLEAGVELEGHEFGSPKAKKLFKENVKKLEVANKHVAQGVDLIGHLARYLYENWDHDYETRLRHSGFRGSLFILRDYRLHLDGLGHALTAMSEHQETIKKAMHTGHNVDEDPAHAVEAHTRAVCLAAIKFLQFEDEVAQTRYVLTSHLVEQGAHLPKDTSAKTRPKRRKA